MSYLIRFVFALIVLSVFISFSCKKKNDTEPTPTATTSPAPKSYPNSLLMTYYNYYDNNGIITKDSLVAAMFFDVPLGTSPTINYVNAGKVSLNNSFLYQNSSLYSNTVAINISDSIKWTASGSGTVSPFSYSYKASYPKYTGGNLLPDTCIKANGITLTISGVSNLQGGLDCFPAAIFPYVK